MGGREATTILLLYLRLAKQLFKAMPKSRGRRIKKDSLETNATFGVNEMAPTLS